MDSGLIGRLKRDGRLKTFETIYTDDGNDEGCSDCGRTIEYGETITVDDEGSVKICSDC